MGSPISPSYSGKVDRSNGVPLAHDNPPQAHPTMPQVQYHPVNRPSDLGSGAAAAAGTALQGRRDVCVDPKTGKNRC